MHMLHIGQNFRNFISKVRSSGDVCLVCSSPIEKKNVTYNSNGKETPKKFKVKFPTLEFLLCHNCGFVSAPNNYYNYLLNPAKNFKHEPSLRTGDGQRKGREYFMALNGANILKKKSISVLIFGAGSSRDHLLIRENMNISECYITDQENFQNTPYFINLDDNAVKFDLVIASEVVEHFLYPLEEFGKLFKKVKKDGLIIVSTNIRNSVDFSKNLYPFIYGHTSYYSGVSLQTIATFYNSYIDFRSPDIAYHTHFNKRYIYLTKDKETFLKEIVYYSSVVCPRGEGVKEDAISSINY